MLAAWSLCVLQKVIKISDMVVHSTSVLQINKSSSRGKERNLALTNHYSAALQPYWLNLLRFETSDSIGLFVAKLGVLIKFHRVFLLATTPSRKKKRRKVLISIFLSRILHLKTLHTGIITRYDDDKFESLYKLKHRHCIEIHEN